MALRSFFRYLAKSNQILYDPAVELELPKTRKNIPRDIMSKKEILKILNQPDPDNVLGSRDKAILELLYSTGIRNQELRNLCIYDIDIANNYLRVTRGKGKKDRVIPLGEIAATYVEEYLNHSRPKLLSPVRSKSPKVHAAPMTGTSNGVNKEETNILFLTKHGRTMKNNGLIETIKKYAAKAKLEKHITPHSFRHTCATHLLKNNASLRHIQELLGHASIESTQIYTRVDISDLKRAHKRYHPRERGE
ncbi:MAG: tyrosine-type recombinase/integrase [Candidatus Omnitrophica bacterium]|nr:tyrosine-type recombinase/integrase [Candidatus Omnitrophota bacterium]